MNKIRSMFAETDMAKKHGLGASAFSFNNKEGQCENCHGDGQITPPFTEDFFTLQSINFSLQTDLLKI